MTQSYSVAIVGATGNVGRKMLMLLEERRFPVDQLYLLASSRSTGERLSFRGTTIPVEDLATFDFSKVRFGLFSPGASVSSLYAPKAAKSGCIVIDNTSFFRMDPEVPLVVPEVNREVVANYFSENNKKNNIIANPNCSTIQMVVALKPLHDAAGIRRIVVSTYQAVSGAGKKAVEVLTAQTRAHFEDPISTTDLTPFSRKIAFNVVPHIDNFLENGYTKEEMKMVHETRKIMGSSIRVTATTVRVPVFNGHAESINIETEKKLTADEARHCLFKAPGVRLIDDPDQLSFVTPLEADATDWTYVSRVREDDSIEKGLNMWVVSDNLRKGAALNAIQIAEELVRQQEDRGLPYSHTPSSMTESTET